MLLSKRYTHFKIALVVCASLVVLLLLLLSIYGNTALFLQMNCNGGVVANKVFVAITETGEIIPWLIALAFVLLYEKSKWLLLVASFVFSTVLVQGIKNTIPTNERPTKALEKQLQQIHTVEGVTMHAYFSFPSGHTTTAFTIFLLACILLPNYATVIIGFFYAVGVAYSRIYLAQHFPADVAGGIVCAMVAVLAALFLYQRKSK